MVNQVVTIWVMSPVFKMVYGVCHDGKPGGDNMG